MSNIRHRVNAARIAVEDAYTELSIIPRHYGGHRHFQRGRPTPGPMRSGCRVRHRDGRQGLFLRFEGPTAAVVYFTRGKEPKVLPARDIVRVA